MTFNELLAKVRNLAAKADVSDKDFLAVQINITGKESGVFYVEVKDHKISVEPYEYNEMMSKARDLATLRMSEEAEKLGADAIVCVRYATSAIMQSAAEVMAYGTAVKFV